MKQLRLKDSGKQCCCQLIPESSTTTKETVATSVLLHLKIVVKASCNSILRRNTNGLKLVNFQRCHNGSRKAVYPGSIKRNIKTKNTMYWNFAFAQ